MALNTEKLRRFNVDLIRNAVRNSDSVSKNGLSLATGLSIATCGKIVDELLAAGEILETGQSSSTGGRPSKQYSYNKNFAYAALIYASIEKGVKSVFYGAVNMTGEILFENRKVCEDISVYELEDVITELLDRYEKTEVLSIGVPGIVHNGVVGLCELEKLSHSHLQQHIEKKFQKKVTVGNDVNCAALGYYNSIKSRNPESLVYIYYTQNGYPGAGIIVNGRILKGKNDFAGEISYLPLGIKMEKQARIQKNSRRFLELLNKTIQSVNCLINPDSIVITCRWFTDIEKETLLQSLDKSLPEKQKPHIVFEPDMHDSYVQGLIIAGMQKLAFSLD